MFQSIEGHLGTQSKAPQSPIVRQASLAVAALLIALTAATAGTPANAFAYQIDGPSNALIISDETVCTNNFSSSPWSWSVTEASSGPMIRFPTGSTPPYQTARRWYYVQQSVDGGRTWFLLFEGQSTASITMPGVLSGTPLFQFPPISKSVYFNRANTKIMVRAWDQFAVYDKYGNRKVLTPSWVLNDTYRTDVLYLANDPFDYNHGVLHYPNMVESPDLV